jgi:acetyl-CoA carboxylase biotin carboxyl carrier protein
MKALEAPVTGTVWRVECSVGDEVSDGDVLVILESMKMEIPIEAEDDGKIVEIRCEQGASIAEGDVVVVVDP